jgi:ubiquitin C-terminal hydrolase
MLISEKYKKSVKPNLPETNLIDEWNNLRDVMWSQNGTVSPNRFVYNVQQMAQQKNRELFTGWGQNDLPEFLLLIIECIHNSISRPVSMRILGKPEHKTDNLAIACYQMLQNTYSKEYSELMDLFYGIYVSELSAIDGTRIHSLKPESFFMLDIEIPQQNATLYDCLDAFTKTEILEGDNEWFNETTQSKESVKKRITFWNFPKVLVITLKRFSADGRRKLQNIIDCPLSGLDLSKYVSGYNAHKYVYDLYGVCNHYGGPMGGHYTAIVKTVDNEWVHYNDSHLERGIARDKIITPSAYCLFYRKK